jgi:hypothetical protein
MFVRGGGECKGIRDDWAIPVGWGGGFGGRWWGIQAAPPGSILTGSGIGSCRAGDFDAASRAVHPAAVEQFFKSNALLAARRRTGKVGI